MRLPWGSPGPIVRHAVHGRDAITIPRCELRDERRAIRLPGAPPTDSAEEPHCASLADTMDNR